MTFKVLLSPPDVGELEQEYVLRAMKSGWVAPAGPDLNAFEAEIADRCGVAHAVGLSSGTAALHLALVSWGVRTGDIVIAPTFTFAATINAIRYVGAEPYLVDCDVMTGNIDPSLLLQALDRLTLNGRRVAAVISVDMLGKCADYSALEPLLSSHGVPLLCDAAESLGAQHVGRPAGCFGDAAVLSFNGNKVMTTSGGGMLLTDDESLAQHVRKLSTQAREPVPHYEHLEVGYNYRLSNILAALGRAQLTRLDDMLVRRRHWRERYRELFASRAGVRILGGDDDGEDNCWLTAVVVDESQAPASVREISAALTDADVESRPVWKPMHLQPVNVEFDSTLNGSADSLFAQGLTLPSGSRMSDADFALISRTVESVMSR